MLLDSVGFASLLPIDNFIVPRKYSIHIYNEVYCCNTNLQAAGLFAPGRCVSFFTESYAR